MSTFHEEARNLEPSALVSLYQLDTTPIGGTVYCFTTETRAGSIVKFAGVDYYAVPVRVSGISVQGQGPLQTPTLSIGNTDGFIQELLSSFGEIEGCTLTRFRVFARHLDGAEDPNPNAAYGPDVYVIDRKSADTPELIEWEMSALIDQNGVFVGRTVIRDTCMFRYREFNKITGQFDYSKAVCPYAGNRYFDRNNNEVSTPEEDVPSRNTGCCKVRFGADQPLPFGGFPGIVRGL